MSSSLSQSTIWRRHTSWLLLHGQCKLKWLLLAALHDLLPELPLMLDTLELRLNVLLRDLKEPKHAVVSLLSDHVQDVPEALRAPLTPSFVNPEGHVLSTFLPTKKLDIGLTLVQTLSIVEAWSREDPNHLREFHRALGQRCDAVFKVLEWLLIDLSVQNIMDCIHLRLPVLLIHVALLLHLPHCVAVLLDVHFVRSTLHSQAIDLFTKLENVPLVLPKASLNTTHPQVECSQAARCLCAAKLCLLLHSTNLLEGLLLLLPDVIFQPGLCVCNVPFKVAADHCHLVEAITERVLGGMQGFLRCSKILIREVDAAIESIHRLVSVADDLGFRLLKVGLDCRDIVTNSSKDLIHFTAAGIHV